MYIYTLTFAQKWLKFHSSAHFYLFSFSLNPLYSSCLSSSRSCTSRLVSSIINDKSWLAPFTLRPAAIIRRTNESASTPPAMHFKFKDLCSEDYLYNNQRIKIITKKTQQTMYTYRVEERKENTFSQCYSTLDVLQPSGFTVLNPMGSFHVPFEWKTLLFFFYSKKLTLQLVDDIRMEILHNFFTRNKSEPGSIATKDNRIY